MMRCTIMQEMFVRDWVSTPYGQLNESRRKIKLSQENLPLMIALWNPDSIKIIALVQNSIFC